MDGVVRPNAEAEGKRVAEEWGSLTWLVSKALTGTAGLTLGRVVIKPGMSNPRHAHPTCDEALYLLAGRLEHSLGDEKVALEAGDTIVVPAGVMHNAVNTGDESADMMVAYSSGTRDFLKED